MVVTERCRVFPVDAELTGPLRTKNSLLSEFAHILEAVLKRQGRGDTPLCNKLIGRVRVTLPQAYPAGSKQVLESHWLSSHRSSSVF